jgi:hypothetical protein
MSEFGTGCSGAEMILPDLVLPSRVNRHWLYSGIDSPDLCLNKEYFRSYPHDIDYIYNSRGFRDEEWPLEDKNLQSAVWCVGDSFTVGLGQPFRHIWPQILADRLGQRTINVSMDGASNDWIFRRTMNIINTVNPKYLVVMWSYTHRAEDTRSYLSDEDRRLLTSKKNHDKDFRRWLDYVNFLKQAPCIVIQSAIPKFDSLEASLLINAENIWKNVKDPSWPRCPQNLYELNYLSKSIIEELKSTHQCWESLKACLSETDNHLRFIRDKQVIYIDNQLDWARDYHHFDILTSQWVVDQILSMIQ